MRSDPHIIVTCDECGSYEDELGLTPLARGGYDERNVDNSLETLGWKLENGRDICPECIEERREGDA